MKPGHSIERMELVDSVLLLQGWVVAEDVSAQPPELTLLGRSATGKAWQLPIPFNRERPDVCAALDIADTSLQCGIFFYGRIPEGKPLQLQRQSPEGDVTLHAWAEQSAGKSGEQRQQRLVSWTYLLRKAWGLLRSGQWRSLSERANRHLRAALVSHQPQRTPAALAQTPQAADMLIIDHDMGGGANHYRRVKIQQLLQQGQQIVLLTFSVLGLRYIAYQVQADGSMRVLKKMAWAEVLPWIDQQQPKQIFYNNAVSFPNALALVEGLAAYKAEHRQACQLTVTVHDYFAVCPSQHLMNAEGKFCDLPDENTCQSCLKRTDQALVSLYRHHGIKPWRQAWGTLLQASDQVLAFDPSAQQVLQRVFRPIAPEHWLLLPHEVPALSAQEQQQLSQWQQNKTRKSGRIGLVGQIGSDYKGVKKVHELIAALAQENLPFEVVAIGQVSPKPTDSTRYRETGPYKAPDLLKLVIENNIDIFFFSSEGPETFSYVLHEIERFSLPIAAFNIGAQATFLAQYSQGISLETHENARDIAHKLKPFLQN